MSRKGVGIGAFDRSRLTASHFASHGSTLRTNNARALSTQLDVFRSLLQQFAQTHAKDIRTDPVFRAQFARMCTTIGIDPLASSARADGGGSSIWANMLGKSVNDFYFELAVRVVEVCGITRGENGGLIGLEELRDRISKGRMEGSSAITTDDLRRAIETLKPLSGGTYVIITVGTKEYVRSVARELNGDQAAVVEAAQVLGYVSVGMLRDNLAWEGARCKTVIEDLVGQGMLWVDRQTGGEWEYWSPGVMGGGVILEGE